MNVRDFGIKHLNTIPGILLPNDVSIVKIEEITKSMERLIDTAPNIVTKLQRAFKSSDQTLFMTRLEEAFDMLSAVYARNLMTSIDRIMHCYKQNNRNVCEVMLEKFTSELLALSISIQKAMLITSLDLGDSVSNKNNQVATDAAIISDLSAVKYLIDIAEYTRAMEMVEDIKGIASFEKTAQIKLLLKRFNGAEALVVVQHMIDELMQKTLGKQMPAPSGKKKILAVDDRPEILAVLSDVLKDEYHILCVSSGEAASRVIEKHDICLFILDIEMPNMNGLELATLIKSKPQYKKMPVVFLTGNATRDYLIKAMKVGAADFIVKPIVRENIIHKVRQYI